MIMLLFLAIALSIDSLGIGLSYGIRRIKISALAMAIISVVTLVICVLAVFLGSLLPLIFSRELAVVLGAIMLAFIGGVIIYNSLKEKEEGEEKKKSPDKEKRTVFSLVIKVMGITINIIKEPESGDMNKSNEIEAREAFYLAVALSLDSVGAAIGSGAIGTNPYLFAILICIFQTLFLVIGSFWGGKLKIKKRKKHIGAFSGAVLIVIAVINVILL